MAAICLVGAGKLGARHLQALKGFKEAHDIYVVEPFEAAREDAKKIYEGTPGQENNVYFLSSVEEVAAKTQNIDVAVVATSSAPRRAVVENMIKCLDIKAMILEKVLFQKTKDLDEVGALLEEKGIRTWVNCPRRYFEVYKEIRENLKEADEFQVNVSGSDWGLGCNGIHFIDLIAYLAGASDAQISIDGLDDEIIESKRKGFCEITGTIRGSVEKCSDFSITSYKTGNIPNSVVITSNISKFVVFEWASKCIAVSAADGIQEKQITIPFQSQLTNIEVEDILYTGDCSLTTYQESAKLHKALMVPLSAYFKERGFEDDLCPIT